MKNFFKTIIVRILFWEAQRVLEKYKPIVIAVTGSVGKTSTKDALFMALSPFFHVRRSEKSFNSETGVPLSILGKPNGWNNPFAWAETIIEGLFLVFFKHTYPEMLVLEVGADKPNDIKTISKWLAPHVVVITRFPDIPAHIEFFNSVEHVIEEKTSLAKALREDGFLVLNNDDEKVKALASELKVKTMTYGLGEGAMMRAENITYHYKTEDYISVPDGLSYVVNFKDETHQVLMKILGEQHIYSALAALSVVSHFKKDITESIKALEAYKTPPGRLSLLAGINKGIIIDDTYNSSPVAALAALTVLKNLKVTGKKIAVLGDMLELGKHTQEAHKEVGKACAEACDFLITVGIRAKTISETAFGFGLRKEHCVHFSTAEEAGEYIKGILFPGDVILFKASQGIRLERAVERVLLNPEEKAKVLVRQEREWQIRK